MPRGAGVGRSEQRTPAKHDLLNSVLGREVGVGACRSKFSDLAWYDLTAGDGAAIDREEWHRGCSPGLFAAHARYTVPGVSPKPVIVHMYERAAGTYVQLVENLSARLPELGYAPIGDGLWQRGRVSLSVHHAEAHTATTAHVGARTAVMLVNDPNNVDQWACPAGLLSDLNRRSPYVCLVSTMGCNAAGLKRLHLTERMRWYDHLNAQLAARAPWHDCYLAAVERDASQWAYLITAPASWREQVSKGAHKAFRAHGLSLDDAWLGETPDRFRVIVDRLFLRASEREEAS